MKTTSSLGLTILGIIFLVASVWLAIDYLIIVESAGLLNEQPAINRVAVYNGLVFPTLLLLTGILCMMAAHAIDIWNGKYQPDNRRFTQKCNDWLSNG